jgi:hypothetical protein
LAARREGAAGAVFIADRGAGNVPVLWVKGLPAAASTVTSGTSLLSGGGANSVSVRVAGTALAGDVGALTPVSGKAAVIPAGTYAIDDAASSADQITLVADNAIAAYFPNSGSKVENTPVPAANGFNKQIIDVLTTGTSGLAAGDKITVDAKGRITSAELIAAPSAAIIGSALTVLDNVTIGLATTLAVDAVVAIGAGKTLTLAASKNMVLTPSSTSVGAKITGAGNLVVRFTEIIPGATGVIASSTANTPTTAIAHTGGVTTITGEDTNAILAVSSGAVITQKAGASSKLTLAAATKVNILDGAELKLEKGAILSGAGATGIVNVGSTAATAFSIEGVASGTLTAGGSAGDTVSLLGLQAGSKIKGSAATATLAGAAADMEIAIAGTATGGAVIDTTGSRAFLFARRSAPHNDGQLTVISALEPNLSRAEMNLSGAGMVMRGLEMNVFTLETVVRVLSPAVSKAS